MEKWVSKAVSQYYDMDGTGIKSVLIFKRRMWMEINVHFYFPTMEEKDWWKWDY